MIVELKGLIPVRDVFYAAHAATALRHLKP